LFFFSDIAQKRLDVAKQFGATHTFLIQDRDSKVVADKIIALLGEKPNVTIECSGAEPSIQTAFYVGRRALTIA
jgi:threonine dehydrogenase-like Zn-dependent dehydrogenase